MNIEQKRAKNAEEMNIEKLKHLYKIYKEINDLIDAKADNEYVDKLDDKFKNYCAYSHLKELRAEVIPVVTAFGVDINEISLNMKQNK